MKGSDPEVENTGPYRALRGATNMMMRRYQESADDFNHFTLANDDDARFWLSRALYFGRLSWHRPVETRPDARNSRRGRPVTWRRLGGR